MIRTICTFIVIVVPSLYFGYRGQTVEMGIWVAIGGIAGAFLNLDKFERFKGAGFEAELKKVVTEAYATIDYMKEVARPLIHSMLSSITYSGRWSGSPQTNDEKRKEDLIKLSKSLDIYDGDIVDAVDTLHRFFTWDHYENIITLTTTVHDKTYDKSGTLLGLELRKYLDRDSTNYPKESTIREVFSGFSYLSDEIKQRYEVAIKNYIYYLENNTPKKDDS